MSQLARIVDGVIAEFLQPVEGFTLAESFPAGTLAACAEAPDEAQIGWVYSDGVFSAPVVVVPTLAQLQAALNAALEATADAVTVALTPTKTHQVGFGNIAAIVTANGNASPSTGADAAAIATIATSFGTNATGINTQAQALKTASLSLLAALVTAQTSTLQATTATQLAAALTAFNTSLASILTTINAVIAVPVTAPPAISIKGINA